MTYDTIGNLTSDGEWNYTWKRGRQLASMTDGETTWTYTYGQSGLRTNRTDGTTNYRYVYDGSQLTFMARNGLYLRFAYTPEGTPLSVLYKGTTYYYVTNLQGDVVAILTGKGYVAVEYTYDAWGNLLSTTGSLANTLGKYNPLRYRGYVYDYETGLYYLQSRYYNPEIGRFINADNYAATGQGFVGNNMFAYCNNNPVIHIDVTGSFAGVLKALAYTTVTVPQLLPIVIVAAAVIIVADPNLREKIADGFEFISATVRTWVDEAEQAIKERLTVSLAKANPPKGNNKHLHHIVAQSASAAGSAQWVLWEVFPDLGVNHPLNLVFVSQRVHQRLHTKVYYIMVNQRIYSAYISAGWDKRQQVLNVAQELLALKIFILSLDAASS